MQQRQAVVDVDGRLGRLEDAVAAAHFHAEAPVLAVGLDALELQLDDGVVGDHVVRIAGQDGVHVLRAGAFEPLIEGFVHFQFGGGLEGFAAHVVSPWFRVAAPRRRVSSLVEDPEPTSTAPGFMADEWFRQPSSSRRRISMKRRSGSWRARARALA
ncbi:hypothetical protein D3C78_1496330 [compost metagenome]